MRNTILKFALAISVSVGVAQIGFGDALAAPGGVPGKPTENTLPKGIQKQIANGKTLHGHWADVVGSGCQSNCGPTDGGGGDTGGDIGTGGSSAMASVCSSSLDEKALLLCLGQPAPKAAVRVKKLNVKLGQD